MRKELGKLIGKRLRFKATIERFGEKSAYKGGPVPTVLLKNVTLLETGQVVTDHLWFARGKSWKGGFIGCSVEFDARVSEYEKGYKGRRNDVFSPVSTDYRLERPTKINFGF